MRLLGTQQIDPSGHLTIGGVDCVDLAREWGTPLYVMDEAAIRERCRAYRTEFETRYPHVEIHFAGKAFLCRGICRLIEEEGLHLDTASGGELFTALQAGFPASRIALHGNNKSAAELRMALDAGIKQIIVDNFHEIDLLAELTEGRDRPQEILLRAAPGIDPQTHRRISTGQVDSKFGFDVSSGAIMQAIRRVTRLPGLKLRGLHCHVGSQLLDTECHEASIALMVDLLAEMRRETGEDPAELNVGGGLGVPYLPNQTPPTIAEFAEAVCGALRAALKQAGLPEPLLALEPGRSLVAEAGCTLYEAGSRKEIPGLRTYVSVDGGLSDNPRPALYDARYNVIVANRAREPHDTVVTIAGKHCETDTLFPDVALADPQPGDILAVQCTGAYNFVMASNYNRFPRPAVVMVRGGETQLLVRRESYADLLARDTG